MTQNKNKFTAFALLGFFAVFLGGCITTRTVSYPEHSFDTVFKSAVTGLCADKDLVVYEADKRKGIIKMQSRSVWGGELQPVFIYGAKGGTPSITVLNNDDWLAKLIDKNLPKGKGKTGVTRSPGKKALAEAEDGDTDLEKQKLELAKEKLQFEKEKLEFEKQKQKGR